MCVFNRLEKDHTQTTLLLHVDDMKIMSSSEIIQVIDEIEAIYPNLTKQRGRIINYLGMTFDYTIPGKVKITMANYIRDVLEGCTDITGTADSPAHSNLFTVRTTFRKLRQGKIPFNSRTATIFSEKSEARPTGSSGFPDKESSRSTAG